MTARLRALRGCTIIDSSPSEENQSQGDIDVLSSRFFRRFRRLPEFFAQPVTAAVIAICVVNFLLVNLVKGHPGSSYGTPRAVPPPILSGSVVGDWRLPRSSISSGGTPLQLWWARDFDGCWSLTSEGARYVGSSFAAAIASSGWQSWLQQTESASRESSTPCSATHSHDGHRGPRIRRSSARARSGGCSGGSCSALCSRSRTCGPWRTAHIAAWRFGYLVGLVVESGKPALSRSRGNLHFIGLSPLLLHALVGSVACAALYPPT